jgi:tRNA-uridine 2-sulfurtransferase
MLLRTKLISLHDLSQSDLSRTIFPLGDYLKTEVKQMASDEGLTTFLEKKESFDICFIGDATYKDFILAKHPEVANLKGGDIHLKRW